MLTQGDSHKSGWPRLTTQPVQDIGFVCYSQDMRSAYVAVYGLHIDISPSFHFSKLLEINKILILPAHRWGFFKLEKPQEIIMA